MALYLDYVRHLHRRDARHLMRLQFRQHLAAETSHLLHEQVVRHRAEIDVDQQLVGAHRLGLLDQPLGDFLGIAESKLAARDLGLDIGTIERTEYLAVDHRFSCVLGPHVVVGRRRHIAARHRVRLLPRRIAAVMPEHVVEVEEVRPVFVDRLGAAVGDPGFGHHADLVRVDAVAILGELLAEIRDHVLHHAGMRMVDRGAEIARRRALDRLLRAGERDPHRRMRLLIGPRPDRRCPCISRTCPRG